MIVMRTHRPPGPVVAPENISIWLLMPGSPLSRTDLLGKVKTELSQHFQLRAQSPPWSVRTLVTDLRTCQCCPEEKLTLIRDLRLSSFVSRPSGRLAVLDKPDGGHSDLRLCSPGQSTRPSSPDLSSHCRRSPLPGSRSPSPAPPSALTWDSRAVTEPSATAMMETSVTLQFSHISTSSFPSYHLSHISDQYRGSVERWWTRYRSWSPDVLSVH